MALHLGEHDLPSPGISSTADAGFPGNGLPGAAGENEEPGVREWALGGSGVAGARRLARGAGCACKSPRGGCAALSFKLWESRFWRQRRCDQSESGDGNKLCKSPSGDGSDDSDSLKTYLAGSAQCDSGEPLLPGLATPVRADLVLVQVPSHSLHRSAAQFSQVFIFYFFHLQLSKVPTSSLIRSKY